jgi:hypothetical protein
MPLSSEEVLEVKSLIEAAQDKATKSQNDRFLVLGTAGGVLAAALIGVYAWGLVSAYSAIQDSEKLSAKEEAHKYLTDAPLITNFQTRLAQAEDSVIQATGAASGARRAAIESEATAAEINKRAAELNKLLVDTPQILKTVNDITKFSNEVARDETFQNVIVQRLTPIIEQGRAAWTQIDLPKVPLGLPLGAEPTSTYTVPGEVPPDAKEILVLAHIETGSTQADNTRTFFISVGNEKTSPGFYLIAHGLAGAAAWSYNTENVWLPLPQNRTLYVKRTGPSLTPGNVSSIIGVVGYR